MKPTIEQVAESRADGQSAFTLIELLAVMSIILVLAGLILAVAGSANYNAAKSRATAEVKAIETACESYKADNGAYPQDAMTTDQLNPVTDFDPNSGKYKAASQFLYQELTGFKAGNLTGKSYLTFKSGQLALYPGGTTPKLGDPGNYIVDPFGFSYGYSTSNAAEISRAAAAVPPGTPATDKGYSPTFDLWSTAGYAPGSGRSTPANSNLSGPALYNTIWVKNW